MKFIHRGKISGRQAVNILPRGSKCPDAGVQQLIQALVVFNIPSGIAWHPGLDQRGRQRWITPGG